ncbi:hypothetical protein CABS01_04811 [Colletotrichum abscissum]|uniref:uncharacterized protein n=1 Tax=Colletotrichum abscissum TaxID=1671311 RepID=UPI0027D71E72|nr:uncharacterized protein CABS01_04811 [Colletotrichum abscissum]KAK1472168.1 hypothetical protein CABS01_04811 [Colletotrichum abscissum]
MDGLEPVDLYMVRQASFTFWHIYQGKEVKKFRRSEAISRARRTGNFVKDPATVLRARPHAFCSQCLTRRLSRATYRHITDTLSRMKCIVLAVNCPTGTWYSLPKSARSAEMFVSVSRTTGSYGFVLILRCRSLGSGIRHVRSKPIQMKPVKSDMTTMYSLRPKIAASVKAQTSKTPPPCITKGLLLGRSLYLRQ